MRLVSCTPTNTLLLIGFIVATCFAVVMRSPLAEPLPPVTRTNTQGVAIPPSLTNGLRWTHPPRTSGNQTQQQQLLSNYSGGGANGSAGGEHVAVVWASAALCTLVLLCVALRFVRCKKGTHRGDSTARTEMAQRSHAYYVALQTAQRPPPAHDTNAAARPLLPQGGGAPVAPVRCYGINAADEASEGILSGADDASLSDLRMCVVCLIRQVSVRVLPCKHEVCCQRCVTQLIAGASASGLTCPVCRQRIEVASRLYET
jgi:hypothetical protein